MLSQVNLDGDLAPFNIGYELNSGHGSILLLMRTRGDSLEFPLVSTRDNDLTEDPGQQAFQLIFSGRRRPSTATWWWSGHPRQGVPVRPTCS